jgi:hypothetical protein
VVQRSLVQKLATVQRNVTGPFSVVAAVVCRVERPRLLPVVYRGEAKTETKKQGTPVDLRFIEKFTAAFTGICVLEEYRPISFLP